jgi:N-acetylmuramoyl-L-alanine amidase
MAAIKVCLDAGHYGKYNRSPAVKTYYEAEAMWKLHLNLKAELEKYGITVITTRADQTKDYGLKARGQVAKGCNLFLSLHSNATGSTTDDSVDYPLVIVPIDGSGDALGNKLTKCIETVIGTKQKGKIWSRKSSSGKNWYGVINGAASVGVTGLILEHSFHTNTKIANWLLNDSNLSAMAKAEAKVIAEHYGLKEQVTTTTATVVSAKQYKVVTSIATYSNAGDAKANKNSVGKYSAGTYYIFTKYPDGVNGMLNITKDKTGATAGAWINPADNVIVSKPVVKAVYELDFPEKHIIITNVAADLDKSACTKAIVAIKKNNANFDAEIAKAFFSLAPKYGIDPMRAISQSVLETGWFKFINSSVKPEQHNYCGLGATGGGVAGAAFDTIELGVIAQLQHLYAYGCKNALPAGEAVVDPRFDKVTRGIAQYWEQLAGRWAVPGFDGDSAEAAVTAGTTYGQKIDSVYKRIVATAVTDSDIALYFVNADNVEEPSTDITPALPVEPSVNTQRPTRPTEPMIKPYDPPVQEDRQDDTVTKNESSNKEEPSSKANILMNIIEKVVNVLLKLFSK